MQHVVCNCVEKRGSYSFNTILKNKFEFLTASLKLARQDIAKAIGVDDKELVKYMDFTERHTPDIRTLVNLCAVFLVRNVSDLGNLGYNLKSDVDGKLIELQLNSPEFDALKTRLDVKLDNKLFSYKKLEKSEHVETNH